MTAAVFPGQGAQFPGMMQEEIEKYPSCKRIIEIADSVLQRDISGLIKNGPKEALNLTENTQPAVLAADLIAYQAKLENGFKPDAAAGFSLGEYAALTAAGVFTTEQVFSIVQQRANAMAGAAPEGIGAMATVLNKSAEEVEALCRQVDGYVVPVNYNCPVQTVISGRTEAIDAFVAMAREQKIRCMKLPVSVPCHCKFMDPAAEVLKKLFETEEFRTPCIPIYMNADAAKTTNPDVIKEKLIRQVNSPVLWEKTIRNMSADGITAFEECGPGTTLTTFVKKILV